MRTLRTLGLAFLWLAASSAVYAQTLPVTAAEAKNHVGEKATVCGRWSALISPSGAAADRPS